MNKEIEERVNLLYRKKKVIENKINSYLIFLKNNPNDSFQNDYRKMIDDLEERLAKTDEILANIKELCKPS
jgi:hypothetical protein